MQEIDFDTFPADLNSPDGLEFERSSYSLRQIVVSRPNPDKHNHTPLWSFLIYQNNERLFSLVHYNKNIMHCDTYPVAHVMLVARRMIQLCENSLRVRYTEGHGLVRNTTSTDI